MASKGKNPPKKAAKKNGYEKPEPLKTGDILINTVLKKSWKIGVSIGVGGFGEIYSACQVGAEKQKIDDYPLVVKIEPMKNGPLFVEMHFYMRNGKSEDIEKFRKENKLKALGMPEFIASGSQDINELKHRYIVLPRFGRDIWKIFTDQGHIFPLHTVYRIGWQILNVLEYIHSCTYVHGDIKGANILLGFGKGGDEQVYLLDFGLACHYNTGDFKPDPKKMHNGTIEYTPRDAHQGVPTMRGDIEILAYNLVQWAGAKLPWVVKKLLAKPVEVQKSKEDFMKGTDKTLKSSFGSSDVPKQLAALFKYLESMQHNTKPDYKKIRGMFEAGLKELGQGNSGVLQFSSVKSKTPTKKKAPAGRPDFNDHFGHSPAKQTDAEDKAGPSKKPASKRSIQPKKYAENSDSESEAEIIPKKATRKPGPAKKAPAAKVVAKKPDKIAEEPERPAKRGRKKVVIESSSEEEDEAPSPIKSPQKKSRVQASPKRSTSKENHGTSESSISPPQKKTKAEPKPDEKKSSKPDDNVKGSITLKSKSNTAKTKKTIQLNFNLDVSLDSDLIVVVNRKDKKKKEDGKKSGDDEPATNEGGTPNRAGVYKGKKAKAV